MSIHPIKKHYWLIIAITVFALDRFSKILIMQNLIPEQPVALLPSLNLYYTFNQGAAFSFLSSAGGWQKWLFIMIAVTVSIAIMLWQMMTKTPANMLKIALALILGGTLGNLYDRITYHYVIDFIDFYIRNWHYPTFNLADTAICIGAGILILDTIRQEKR